MKSLQAKGFSGRAKTLLTWGAASLLGVLHVLEFAMPFEDAFITFRYAEHIAGGHGFVYNIGSEAVEGFSSVFWLLWLTLWSWLGASLPVVAFLSSLCSGVLLLIWTARLTERYAPAGQARGMAPLLSILLVAAHGTWAYYSASGMENVSFSLFLVLAVGATLRPGKFSSTAIAAVWLLAVLTRPEGIGYAGIALGVGVLSPIHRRKLGLAALQLAAGFGLLVSWRMWLFGYPLPNTYYAKASPGGQLFLRGLAEALSFALSHLLWVMPWAWWRLRKTMGLPGVKDEAWRIHGTFAALILGSVVNVVLVGGDTFAFYRFFLPVLPFMAIQLALVLASLDFRVLGPAIVAMCIATYGVSHFPRFSLSNEVRKSDRECVDDVSRINSDYFLVGQYLRETYSQDKLLATNAAGIVPFVSKLRTVDMLGLNDKHIAHRDMALGIGVSGHEKHDASYVLSLEPDILIPALPSTTGRRPTLNELSGYFLRFERALPGDHALLTSPVIRRDYSVVSVRVSNSRWFSYLERNGTERKPIAAR